MHLGQWCLCYIIYPKAQAWPCIYILQLCLLTGSVFHLYYCFLCLFVSTVISSSRTSFLLGRRGGGGGGSDAGSYLVHVVPISLEQEAWKQGMCLVSSGLNLNRKGGPNSDTLWDMDMGSRGGGSMEDIARDGGCTDTLWD